LWEQKHRKDLDQCLFTATSAAIVDKYQTSFFIVTAKKQIVRPVAARI
jgi:hypothetical protein